MLPQKQFIMAGFSAATYSIIFKGRFVPHYRIYNLGLSVVNMKIKFEWIIMTLSLFKFLFLELEYLHC